MEERRQKILQELEEKGRVRVTDLSKSLNCSEVTIRSDIKAMQEEGLLKRIHGGAIRLESVLARKYNVESIYRNADRKEDIARKAYEYIEDGDTIIIDDASTSFYLALHIKSHPEKRIAVVTNSLLTGNELAGVSHVELYMIGGYVGGHLSATMGEAPWKIWKASMWTKASSAFTVLISKPALPLSPPPRCRSSGRS